MLKVVWTPKITASQPGNPQAAPLHTSSHWRNPERSGDICGIPQLGSTLRGTGSLVPFTWMYHSKHNTEFLFKAQVILKSHQHFQPLPASNRFCNPQLLQLVWAKGRGSAQQSGANKQELNGCYGAPAVTSWVCKKWGWLHKLLPSHCRQNKQMAEHLSSRAKARINKLG